MNKVIAILLLAAAACTDAQASETAALSTNPTHWAEGTWTCRANYHDVAPYTPHSVLAIYTVSEDARGILHGRWEESPGGATAPINFSDAWSIGVPDTNGDAAATIAWAASDGSTAVATGAVRASIGKILGTVNVTGTYAASGGTQQTWTFNAIEVQPPTEFIADWALGTSTTQLVYLDALCVLQPTNQ